MPDLPSSFCISDKVGSQLRPIQRYSVEYQWIEDNGEVGIASGLVAFRANSKSVLTPVIYMHATSASKLDVPSQGSFESNYASCKVLNDSNVFIAPDYYGMGLGTGFHPYMITDPTVHATLSFYDIALRVMKSLKKETSDSVVLAGYSQGGHAALAVHRFIDANQLPIKVKKTFALSGPTSLSVNMVDLFLYGEPNKNTRSLVSLVLVNYNQYYGGQYSSSPFIPEYSIAEDFALSMNKKAIDESLPRSPYEFLSEDFLEDLNLSKNHPFRMRLAENDIVPWTFSGKIILAYSEGDTTIPPKDTKEFFASMSKISPNVSLFRTSKSLPHTANFLKSLDYLGKILLKERMN
jgi:hypothetical protein